MAGRTLKPSGILLTAHLAAAWMMGVPGHVFAPWKGCERTLPWGTGVCAWGWWHTPATPDRVLVTPTGVYPGRKLLESHVGLDAQCCHLSHQRGPDPASILGTHTTHPVVEGTCEIVQRHKLEPLFRPLFIELDEHLVTADANDAVYLDAST